MTAPLSRGEHTRGLELEFVDDPADFLAVATDRLAADPVISTVVATIAEREAAQGIDATTTDVPYWWLVVRDAQGRVVGTGMRTAPFAPYPAFLLPMPAEAAIAVAHALHDRGEQLLGLNGVLPTIELCATETATLAGGRVEVAQHTRLHELGEIVRPRPVPGRLATATEDDVDLATAWFDAFMGDADEQAGRPRGSSAHEAPDRPEMLRRLRAGRLWFWLDEAGEPVHLTGANPPAFGVARVGPVYTPPAHRGRGYASNAVAEVSRLLQADGARVCLYTDQANPTSNKVYAALGYRPVVDMANLRITRRPDSTT
jgi:GNAT superfamily N-acetyltransferase